MVHAAISLLQGEAPLQLLAVSGARLGIDTDPQPGTRDERIPGAQVAWIRKGTSVLHRQPVSIRDRNRSRRPACARSRWGGPTG